MQASAIVADRNKVTAKMLRSGDLPLADGWDDNDKDNFDPDVEIDGQEGLSHVTVTIKRSRQGGGGGLHI